MTAKTMRELWCRFPEGKRQSGYDCWSGDSLQLLSLALPGMSQVGYQADAAAPDLVDPSVPPHGPLTVAKHRTMSLRSRNEARGMALVLS
jgi:hypothetical protein